MTEQLNAGVIPGLYDAKPMSVVSEGPHKIQCLKMEWGTVGTGQGSTATPAFVWKGTFKAVDTSSQGSLPWVQNIFLPYGTKPSGVSPEEADRFKGREPESEKEKGQDQGRLAEIKTICLLFGVRPTKESGLELSEFAGKTATQLCRVKHRDFEGRPQPQVQWPADVL